MSRFGLSVDAFLEITPYEFYTAIKDNEETELGRARVVCDTMRMSTWWTVNLQLPRGKKIRKAKQMWQYDWDKVTLKPQTLEEMKAVMKAIGSVGGNRKNKPPRGRKGIRKINTKKDAR